MYYDHSTCMYYDHSICMYYDHSTCMYYGHSTCMYMVIVYVSCPIRLSSLAMEVGGPQGRSPSGKQGGFAAAAGLPNGGPSFQGGGISLKKTMLSHRSGKLMEVWFLQRRTCKHRRALRTREHDHRTCPIIVSESYNLRTCPIIIGHVL